MTARAGKYDVHWVRRPAWAYYEGWLEKHIVGTVKRYAGSRRWYIEWRAVGYSNENCTSLAAGKARVEQVAAYLGMDR